MKTSSVYAAILAGGNGTRMGGGDKPKQFLHIGHKPIIIHTIEKFLVHNDFEQIVVLCPMKWIPYTNDIIRRYIGEFEKIHVISGGSTRNDTIMQAIDYIEEKFSPDDDAILVTHDSVRPFVTHRIIQENIQFAQKVGACDTVIAATDTIVVSEDGVCVSEIPNRVHMYQGQTPQSFQMKKLKALYQSIPSDKQEILTDACKIYILNGEPVHLVEGEVSNIKITYPYDLRMAESLLK